MLELVKGEIVEKQLISQEQIAARVKELAKEINEQYAGQQITLLGTLVGANIFMSDLAREISLNVQLDFVKVASYGDGTETSGNVELVFPPTLPLAGANVIIVEDIIDSGNTAVFLRDYVAKSGAASVAMCALLNKPSRRLVANLQCEYIGFDVENVFVVGYGLDYAQRYRNLPYIGILNLDNNEVN